MCPIPAGYRRVVSTYVHLPNAFILTVPFGLLAWGPAYVLWMALTAISFILAAYLMWSLGADYAPVASGVLICVFLLNSELLLEIGNAAGIAISLCVIAVWCFVKKRLLPIGILCLAVSLLITPHDGGLVWLYFLLAGGGFPQRALQTLVLAIALSLPGILWISHVAPNWMQELHANTLNNVDARRHQRSRACRHASSLPRRPRHRLAVCHQSVPRRSGFYNPLRRIFSARHCCSFGRMPLSANVSR